MHTDDHDTGYGGFVVEHGCHIAHGQWSPVEAQQSSTWCELCAIRLVLKSLVTKFENERVLWFTDTQNLARILLVGSKMEVLQEEVIATFFISMDKYIRTELEWVPHYENQWADYLGWIVDHDDWHVHADIFAEFDEVWDPRSIDQFVSYCNAELPIFNSRFWNPGTEAFYAFTCNW